MSRDEVLERLHHNRALFDRRVAAIPREVFDVPVPGATHTPKQIVAHVSAYEELIVERLRAARLGETTAFDRDRVGWEAFNERIWAEGASADLDDVLAWSRDVFAHLIHEIALLEDVDMIEKTGITAHLDPAWLQGRTLAELIGIDAFDHYPMHFEALERAATSGA